MNHFKQKLYQQKQPSYYHLNNLEQRMDSLDKIYQNNQSNGKMWVENIITIKSSKSKRRRRRKKQPSSSNNNNEEEKQAMDNQEDEETIELVRYEKANIFYHYLNYKKKLMTIIININIHHINHWTIV